MLDIARWSAAKRLVRRAEGTSCDAGQSCESPTEVRPPDPDSLMWLRSSMQRAQFVAALEKGSPHRALIRSSGAFVAAVGAIADSRPAGPVVAATTDITCRS